MAFADFLDHLGLLWGYFQHLFLEEIHRALQTYDDMSNTRKLPQTTTTTTTLSNSNSTFNSSAMRIVPGYMVVGCFPLPHTHHPTPTPLSFKLKA